MSNATMDSRPEIASYLDAVRAALDDLPTVERDDLLAEVESSLIDAADESGGIAARMGPPDEFAAELRAAAGLGAPARRSQAGRSPRELVRDGMRAARAIVASRALSELAPLWWAARAYVAVAFVGVAGAGWSVTHPAVPSIGNGKVGLLAILATAVVSVWLGLRGRRSGRKARLAGVAANIALVLLAVPVLQHVAHGGTASQTVVEYVPAAPQAGLLENGAPVTNIYPYSRTGRLLHDVLLYDGSGNPIEIGPAVSDPNRRLLRTARRYEPVYNAFPIRYYEPGTTLVSHPSAGPRVRIPRLVPGP
jgi:hypothetical protein